MTGTVDRLRLTAWFVTRPRRSARAAAAGGFARPILAARRGQPEPGRGDSMMTRTSESATRDPRRPGGQESCSSIGRSSCGSLAGTVTHDHDRHGDDSDERDAISSLNSNVM